MKLIRRKLEVKKKMLFASAGVSLLLVTGALTLLFGAGWIIRRAAAGRIDADSARLPVNDVGLVLGTSKQTRGGYRNPHFFDRLDAAAALYHAGRVRHLLLSGDNGSRGYDEPTDMRDALVERGVPAADMTLDYAGFRTLDSVIRARRVFGQRRLTIITSPFHTDRAVFLARQAGIDAVAFPCRDIDLRYSYKTKARECFADVKACLDVWVFGTEPRFLGEPVEVRVAGR